MTYGDGGSRGGGFRSGGFRGGGGFRRNFGPREMHKITCSECGKEAEVPFKPRQGTPVYCKDCFFKRKGMEPRSEGSSHGSSEGGFKKKEKVEEAEDDMEESEDEEEDEEM